MTPLQQPARLFFLRIHQAAGTTGEIELKNDRTGIGIAMVAQRRAGTFFLHCCFFDYQLELIEQIIAPFKNKSSIPFSLPFTSPGNYVK